MRYKPRLKLRKEVITLERLADHIFEAQRQIATSDYEVKAYNYCLGLVERRYHELTGRRYYLRRVR